MNRRRAVVGCIAVLVAAACGDAGLPTGEPTEALAAQLEPTGAWERDPASVDGAVEVQILQPLSATLRVWLRNGWELDGDPPAAPEGFRGEFEALTSHTLDSGSWQRWRVTLRPVRTGEVVLPAFEFAASSSEGEVAHASTRPVGLLVRSRLDADDEGAMEELGLEPEPLDPWPWVGGGALGFAALALLVWWWRRRPQRPAPAAVDVPAHVRAERALLALRDRPRQTEAQIEAFYVDVSSVLRGYIEERFGVAAPERTTDEFLAECDGHPALGAARAALGRFLERCDLVKFAGDRPMGSVHEQVLDEALAFVESTRPDRLREEAMADV